MSRRGDCYDNAAMESWFSTLMFELGERFDSPSHAKQQLFDYIEVFYNQKRRHSSLGYATPADTNAVTVPALRRRHRETVYRSGPSPPGAEGAESSPGSGIARDGRTRWVGFD
jgi:transposase InsO family protein